MRTRMLAVVTGLSLVGPALAQQPSTLPGNLPQTGSPTAQPSTAPPVTNYAGTPIGPTVAAPDCCPPACGPTCPTDPTRWWVGAEALGWWVQGQHLPSLVTTSPVGTPLGTAGVLGQPGTATVVGGSRVNDDMRFGGRFTLGTWLDDQHQWGLGGEFFILNQSGQSYTGSSAGDPILARPFFNTLTNRPDAQIIAFPGVAAGSYQVNASSNLLGAAGYALHQLCCGCDYRVYALAGYRYLRLQDTVDVYERVTATGPAGVTALPAGTVFGVHDHIRTLNEFHGGDIGLWGRFYRGPVFFDLMGRLGLGTNLRVLSTQGATSITAPGGVAGNFPGGLIAQGPGQSVSDWHFAFVPELRLNVGYQVTDNLSVFVGYNVLWWTNVIRAGDQIAGRTNPLLLPPPLAAGAPVPAPRFHDTTIWAQGINLGLLLRY